MGDYVPYTSSLIIGDKLRRRWKTDSLFVIFSRVISGSVAHVLALGITQLSPTGLTRIEAFL